MCLDGKDRYLHADIVRKVRGKYECSHGRCIPIVCTLSRRAYRGCPLELTTHRGYLLLKRICGNREEYYLIPASYTKKRHSFSRIPSFEREILVDWILRNKRLLYLVKENGIVVYKAPYITPFKKGFKPKVVKALHKGIGKTPPKQKPHILTSSPQPKPSVQSLQIEKSIQKTKPITPPIPKQHSPTTATPAATATVITVKRQNHPSLPLPLLVIAIALLLLLSKR